jgi:hypothetical protein
MRGDGGRFNGSSRTSLRRNADARMAAGEMTPAEEARFLRFRQAALRANEARDRPALPQGMTPEQIAWATEVGGDRKGRLNHKGGRTWLEPDLILAFAKEGVRHGVWN